MTNALTGLDAIATAEFNCLTLNKYADPIEGAREGLTVAEAREIAAEDASLIYLPRQRATIEDRGYGMPSVGQCVPGIVSPEIYRIVSICGNSAEVEPITWDYWDTDGRMFQAVAHIAGARREISLHEAQQESIASGQVVAIEGNNETVRDLTHPEIKSERVGDITNYSCLEDNGHEWRLQLRVVPELQLATGMCRVIPGKMHVV